MIDVSPRQPENAPSRIVVSELGNVIDVFLAGQMIMVDKFLSYSTPSIDENVVLSASTLILIIAAQPENA